MKEMIAILLIVIGVFAGTIGVTIYKDAHAATPAKYNEGCVQLGVVGSIIVAQCYDAQGNPFVVNSVGFMGYPP